MVLRNICFVSDRCSVCTNGHELDEWSFLSHNKKSNNKVDNEKEMDLSSGR